MVTSHSIVMPGPQNLQNLSNCSHRAQSYCHSNSRSQPESQTSCSIPTSPFCRTAPLVFMTDFKSTAEGKNSIKKPQQISLQTESIGAVCFGRDGEENNFFSFFGPSVHQSWDGRFLPFHSGLWCTHCLSWDQRVWFLLPYLKEKFTDKEDSTLTIKPYFDLNIAGWALQPASQD